METKLNKRVVVNSAIMAGKPIIKGTRIPVDVIIHLLSQGMTPKEIIEDYPNLTKEDILAAVKSKGDPIMAAAGIWKDLKETGAEYQKRIRSQWKKRQKALDW